MLTMRRVLKTIGGALRLWWSILTAAVFSIPLITYPRLQASWSWLPQVDAWLVSLILGLLVLVAAFVTRLVRLEQKLNPQLAVLSPVISEAVMGPKGGLLNPADLERFRVNYVHIVIENTGATQIDNCSVLIVGLRKRATSESREVVAKIGAPIALVSSQTHLPQVTVRPGVPAHFDLVAAAKNYNKLWFANKIAVPYAIPQDFFEKAGDYEFEIKVTGDNTPTVSARIRVTWIGQWNNMCRATHFARLMLV